MRPATDSVAIALEKATNRVRGVADDPEGRYSLCAEFYRRYGFGPGFGLGASELDFVRWEITRGVLNPLDHPQPGSRWWRAVNGGLLYHAEAAAALEEAGLGDAATGPIRAWVGYLRSPSPHSWYRAHNSSTVEGYLGHVDAAHTESAAECTFINVVLYRVLYAQALVESSAPGLLGRIAHHFRRLVGDLERMLADPRSPSVDVLLHLPDFYPRHYPLSAADAAEILRRGHGPEAFARILMDNVFIAPCLTALYAEAAQWLEMPKLSALVVDNRPVYPHCALTDSTEP